MNWEKIIFLFHWNIVIHKLAFLSCSFTFYYDLNVYVWISILHMHYVIIGPIYLKKRQGRLHYISINSKYMSMPRAENGFSSSYNVCIHLNSVQCGIITFCKSFLMSIIQNLPPKKKSSQLIMMHFIVYFKHDSNIQL